MTDQTARLLCRLADAQNDELTRLREAIRRIAEFPCLRNRSGQTCIEQGAPLCQTCIAAEARR